MINKFKDLIDRKKHYKAVFNSAEGKVVLKDLIKFCGLYECGFGATPEVTAFNEGRRRVILRIISILGQSDKALEQFKDLTNNEDINE